MQLPLALRSDAVNRTQPMTHARRRASSCIRAAAVTAIALLACHAHAFAQSVRVTVSGHVVSTTGNRLITGAEVEINARSRMTSTADGQFRFTAIPTGPAVIFVRALGYEDLEIRLRLTGDTTIELKLKEAPIQLSGINVVSRDITVRGRVIADSTKMGVDGNVFSHPCCLMMC